jgi:YidC/Oxa1 family membrane protein insertase
MNSEDSRNLILAIVLSVLVLIGWNYFYGAPQLQKDHQAQTQAQPNPAAPLAPGAVAPLNAAPAAAAPETRDQALAAASRRITIDTKSLGGSINLTGGLLDDLTLKAYRETIDPNSPNITLFSPQGGPEPYLGGVRLRARRRLQGEDARAGHGLDQRFADAHHGKAGHADL